MLRRGSRRSQSAAAAVEPEPIEEDPTPADGEPELAAVPAPGEGPLPGSDRLAAALAEAATEPGREGASAEPVTVDASAAAGEAREEARDPEGAEVADHEAPQSENLTEPAPGPTEAPTEDDPAPAEPEEAVVSSEPAEAEKPETETEPGSAPEPEAGVDPEEVVGETGTQAVADDSTAQATDLPPAVPAGEVTPEATPDDVVGEASPEPGPAHAPSGGARTRPPLPRIIAVANQKGGVGKTTTAVNLGACLADLGYRTLVVDLDPQGNASTGLGINIRGLSSSMYEVILSDVPIEDCVEASSVKNLFVAPASLDLAGAEIELVPAFSREMRLKQALAEVRDDYDYVLIDCPPSLGLLTINAMAAATEILVPIQTEYYALEGLGQLLRNVGLVTKNLNPTLDVSTIVLVMYDARTKLSDQVAQEVREHFGDKVCKIMIPRTIRLSEAPSFGQPISAFDPGSRGAVAYRELAMEVSGGPA